MMIITMIMITITTTTIIINNSKSKDITNKSTLCKIKKITNPRPLKLKCP